MQPPSALWDQLGGSIRIAERRRVHDALSRSSVIGPLLAFGYLISRERGKSSVLLKEFIISYIIIGFTKRIYHFLYNHQFY